VYSLEGRSMQSFWSWTRDFKNYHSRESEMISGIDISHHNGHIDWAKMKGLGKAFAFLKATEGTSFIDPMFARNLRDCRSAGLPVGAYHFFRPELDPALQSSLFLRVVGKAQHGDLPPVLDWEVSDNVRPGVQVQRAKIWLEHVEQFYGKPPIIYGSPSFLAGLGLPVWFTNYKLWIANYGVHAPHIPAPWKSHLFWQTSDAGGLDLDVFNGTPDQLNALRA
jgi:lysozyme